MSHHLFPWREPFLQALRDYPVVQHACDAVGILRCTAYRTRAADKAFAEAWEDAMECGTDRAEKEAFRRGVHGFEEPVIHKGEMTYQSRRLVDDEGNVTWEPVLDTHGQPVPLTVRKHSDVLLALVLKARRQSYRVERTEVTSPDGSMSPTDEASRHARVAALMAKARAAKAAAARAENPKDRGAQYGAADDFSDLA